jgi:hypothetical protein
MTASALSPGVADGAGDADDGAEGDEAEGGVGLVAGVVGGHEL